MMDKLPVTVLILTKNEETLIRRCMSSVTWADEILILDSGSADRTCELARQAGASVYHQDWLGWVPQRQRSIALARHDWVFTLDADEIVSTKLAEAIHKVMLANPDPSDGYSVDRRDELFGRLMPNMKQNAMRQTFVRLFNRTKSNYDPAMPVHERVVYPGRAILLDGLLLHWRNVTLLEQQRKIADYGLLEADQLEQLGVRCNAVRVVWRPVLRFVWTYVLRGAFRAGGPGLIYALMAAQGEFVRHAMLWERQNAENSIYPPASLFKPQPAFGLNQSIPSAAPSTSPSAAPVVQESGAGAGWAD